MSKLPLLGALCVFAAAGVALAVVVVNRSTPPPDDKWIAGVEVIAGTEAAAGADLTGAPRVLAGIVDSTSRPTQGDLPSADTAAPRPHFAAALAESPPLEPFPRLDAALPPTASATPGATETDGAQDISELEPATGAENSPSTTNVARELVKTLQRLIVPPARETLEPARQASPNDPSTVSSDPAASTSAASTPASTAMVRVRRVEDELPAPRRLVGEGDAHLQMDIRGDIREVLAGLSEQLGMNILPTKSVQGSVSLSLTNVSAEEALDAILKSTGYVAQRDKNFIYVGAPEELSVMMRPPDKIATRIYRPNYVTARELQTLITPLLTPTIGIIQSTSQSKIGIPPDDTDAGGDDYAGAEALLVKDFESVLREVDQIVAEIDCQPLQVAIEAMILSVQLKDENQHGIDWQLLQQRNHLRFALGTPPADLGQVSFNNGGLTFAFLDSNLTAFVKALETIGDTNVIATPRLMVLNKHRAEILIGAQLGYVNTTVTETTATQSVEFLDIGTQLRLRPFIYSDGNIRMEIHPELSTGSVRIQDGLTLPDKEVTKVTTNILVQDGNTVIIGGLIREDLITTARQVPLLGSLPFIGPLFRTKEERTEKREILVLITPRIVRQPEVALEGERAAAEFHRRQGWYADKMSPIGKRSLGRKHFRLAQEAWAHHDRAAAMHDLDLSLHLDPLNRAALDLRSDIASGIRFGSHTLDAGIPPPVADTLLDRQDLPEWLLEELVDEPTSPTRPSLTSPSTPALRTQSPPTTGVQGTQTQPPSQAQRTQAAPVSPGKS